VRPSMALAMAFGAFYQSPSIIERAMAFGSGAAALTSFAYKAYRAACQGLRSIVRDAIRQGLVDLIDTHMTRWARESMVRPIANLAIAMNRGFMGSRSTRSPRI